ncbi:MAG: hypothetical protein JSV24_08770, partial [Bacteroidales bacterium]
MEKKIYEKKKIPGLFYAFTDNGVELPVLDITHPLFIESINEQKLGKMLKEIEKKGDERAESFDRMPAFLKNFLAKRSYIMAGFLLKDTDGTFLSGMSTLIMKLGPGLIGSGRKKFFDRLGSKSCGAVMLRMRVRDICKLQTEILIPQLMKEKGTNLCFVNIAGGTASDSINTLINIHKKDSSLLRDRCIEINVLDVEEFGSNFANRCIESLKAEGGYFHDLDISFRYINYNWNNTEQLIELLSGRGGWSVICSSEGGLFEYASDEEITQNLNILYDYTHSDMRIAGSLIRDPNTVDPGILSAMKITKVKARLLGL